MPLVALKDASIDQILYFALTPLKLHHFNQLPTFSVQIFRDPSLLSKLNATLAEASPASPDGMVPTFHYVGVQLFPRTIYAMTRVSTELCNSSLVSWN